MLWACPVGGARNLSLGQRGGKGQGTGAREIAVNGLNVYQLPEGTQNQHFALGQVGWGQRQGHRGQLPPSCPFPFRSRYPGG